MRTARRRLGSLVLAACLLSAWGSFALAQQPTAEESAARAIASLPSPPFDAVPAEERRRALVELIDLADRIDAEDPTLAQPLELARRALELARSLNEPETEANVAYRLATMLSFREQSDAAREVIEQQLAHAKAPWMEPLLRAELVQIAWRRGDLGRADRELALLEKAAAERPSNRDEALIDAWTSRTVLSLHMGLLDQALTSLRELEAVESRLKAAGALDPRTWMNIRCQRLDVLLAAEEFEDALDEATRARAEAPDWLAAVGDQAIAYYEALALGSLALSRSTDDARSVERLEAEAEVAGRNPADRVNLKMLLAWIHSDRGRLDACERTLASAEAILRDEVQGERTALRANLLALRAALSIARGEPRESLAALHDRFRETCDRLLEQWRAIPARKGGLGALHFASRRAVLAQLMHLALLALPRGDEVALGYLIEAQAIGSLARELAALPIGPDQVRALLASDAPHGVLIVLPTIDRTHLWLVDRERIERFEAAGVLDLRAMFDRLRAFEGRGLEGDERARFDALALEAGRALLPERARERLRAWRTVSVVGGDFFGWFPIEMLALDLGRPLGAAHAFEHWPSLPLAVALDARRKPEPAPETRQVLVAAPTMSDAARERWSELAPLEFDAREREQIAIDGAEQVELRARAATRSALAAALARPTQVLSVVAHGAQATDLERPAAIVLASDVAGDLALFTCDDVERTGGADLVELAVCGALRGPFRAGNDGSQHLGGAFLRAGATAVLLSRADLRYRATLALLERFHVELRAGASAAEALRSARAAVIADDASRAFDANAVQLVGIGSLRLPMKRERPRSWIVGVAVATVALTVLLAARRRRRQGVVDSGGT